MPDEPPAEPTPMPERPADGPPPAASGNGDEAAARLVAMKMALEGASREAVAEHLADAYGLERSEALLDDVYARVEK